MHPGPPENKEGPINDRDADGIADELDRCPDVPEDLDGNEDEDGCPEDDRFRRRHDITDTIDMCARARGF
ncbi:MAG: hypothetical protein R3C68_08250 [Myxococcota bacterium]